MPYDAVVMACAVQEISALLPARVDRIGMAGAHQALLTLFRPGYRTQLLICLHPRHARVHLSNRGGNTGGRPSAEPSSFLPVLRKHLEGGTLVACRQENRDRLLRLFFRHLAGGERQLVVEIKGPGSNLILLDAEEKILAAWREEPLDHKRPLLPGVLYQLPPPPPGPGWGPFATRELLARTEESDLARVAARLWQEALTHPCPTLILDEEGKPCDYWCLPPLAHGPRGPTYPTMGQLLDDFYARREQEEELDSRREKLGRLLRRQRERQERLAVALREDLQKAEEAQRYRQWGELLLAQAAALPPGQEKVRVWNYFLPAPSEIEIPLDPGLSAKENAQRYFRQYAKSKRALALLRDRLEEAQAHLAYLERLQEALVQVEDPEALRRLQEKAEREFRSRPAPKKTPRALPPPVRKAPSRRETPSSEPHQLLRFPAPDGGEILVGKDAAANDFLTFVWARPDDIWLHARGIPGSHVLLRPPSGRQPTGEALSRAAALAAYFSKGREGGKVAVDWTLRKHVKRRPGGKPGQVLYRHERTLSVAPAPPPCGGEEAFDHQR